MTDTIREAFEQEFGARPDDKLCSWLHDCLFKSYQAGVASRDALSRVLAELADEAERVAIPFNKEPNHSMVTYEIGANTLLKRFIALAFRERDALNISKGEG